MILILIILWSPVLCHHLLLSMKANKRMTISKLLKYAETHFSRAFLIRLNEDSVLGSLLGNIVTSFQDKYNIFFLTFSSPCYLITSLIPHKQALLYLLYALLSPGFEKPPQQMIRTRLTCPSQSIKSQIMVERPHVNELSTM